jgi:Dynein, heavy chain
LFLSSMPCDYFPVTVLQNSVKLTNEPPKGLKANMMRTYNDLTQERLEDCKKPEVWRKLLFSLSFFHAVVQERRKFGPLGWNIRYEFNESDLETSFTMLKNMLDDHQEILWDAIRFVTGEINYGGRVTDDWDRRCLLAILNQYCVEPILNDTYTFSKSGIYKSPPDSTLEGYKAIISNFPDIDDPEVFGMHSNANITFEMTESSLALETILSIQPRDAGASAGKSPDEIVEELATALEARIPPVIKKEEDRPDKAPKLGYIDSLGVCLQQEIERFNRLLTVMRKTLNELKRAIKGEVLMSVELDKMYQSLLNNQVPALWKKVSYPSLKNLASWFEDLIQRVAFFEQWLNKGKPRGYWISAFFFPQGFLTSVLQNYARKYKTPIDILSFAYDFLDFTDIAKVERAPEDGCYIYGLYIEGCRFDLKQGRLEDSRPGEMYTEAPVIYFSPQENYTPEPIDYAMPVYKTTTRAGTLSTTGHSTNFIIAIDVPTKHKPEYWILNGAAFVCQLNN